MNNKLQQFENELSELLKKYGYDIESEADAADDTNLRSWIEIVEVVPERGRWPKRTILKECEGIGVSYLDE